MIFDQDRAFDFELSRGRGVDRGAPPGATTAPTQETPPAGGAPTNPEPTIYRGEERDMRREF